MTRYIQIAAFGLLIAEDPDVDTDRYYLMFVLSKIKKVKMK